MVSLASSPESGEMRRTKSSRGRSPRSRSRSRSSTPKSISKSLSKGSSSRSRSSSRSLPSRRFRARRPTGRARGKARSASGGSRGSRSRSASEEYYYYKGRSPGDDSTNSTVFVGGMSASTDERSLREFFQKFGTVVETKAVLDPDTHSPRCFGFVRFGSASDADLAVSQAHGKMEVHDSRINTISWVKVLDGNTIRCNLARYPRPHGRKRGDKESPIRDRLRVKGRGERRYKRSLSPGRWGEAGRSRSNNSHSRSRSISRPRSPARKYRRSPSRSKSSPRGRWHGRSRSRSHSRSRSRTRSKSPVRYRGRKSKRSYSYARRSISSPRRSPIRSKRSSGRWKRSISRPKRSPSRQKRQPSKDPSVEEATKQELSQARAKEQELIKRISELEAESEREAAAKGKATASLVSLTNEFRAVADRCKNRGAMLAKILGALKEVDGVKQHLESAQANLEAITHSAVGMLQEEERNFQSLENAEGTNGHLKGIDDRAPEESHDDSPDIPASGGTLLEKYAEEATQEEDVGQMVTTPPPLPSVSPPHVASGEKDTVAKNWKPLTFRIKL